MFLGVPLLCPAFVSGKTSVKGTAIMYVGYEKSVYGTMQAKIKISEFRKSKKIKDIFLNTTSKVFLTRGQLTVLLNNNVRGKFKFIIDS